MHGVSANVTVKQLALRFYLQLNSWVLPHCVYFISTSKQKKPELVILKGPLERLCGIHLIQFCKCACVLIICSFLDSRK